MKELALVFIVLSALSHAVFDGAQANSVGSSDVPILTDYFMLELEELEEWESRRLSQQPNFSTLASLY